MTSWADAAESDIDVVFQVMSDMIGISEAIHIMETGTAVEDAESDDDSDTIVDDDRTECDMFLDELDDISEIGVDPS